MNGLHVQAVALVCERMDEAGMTQTEMARRMGWSLKHVNRILQGHVEPSMASLEFMGFILGLRFTVSALPAGEGAEPRDPEATRTDLPPASPAAPVDTGEGS